MKTTLRLGRHSIAIWADLTTGEFAIATGYKGEGKILIQGDVSTPKMRKLRHLFDQIDEHFKDIGDE